MKDKDDKKRQQATKRQQEKRAKDKERYADMGIQEVRIKLSQTERDSLEELRLFRGGYDVNEYIATLIRRDSERMQEEKKSLGTCEFCHEPLPMGCKNGVGSARFKGYAQCFYTSEEKKLRL
ncbi:hypothetical protein [Marinomonas sp.]